MSNPKIFLLHSDGERTIITTPFAGSDHAVAPIRCPACGHGPEFNLAGSGRRISADDRAYEADAIAYCCNQQVGTIRAEMNTLFGLREDEAVARLGVRIY